MLITPLYTDLRGEELRSRSRLVAVQCSLSVMIGKPSQDNLASHETQRGGRKLSMSSRGRYSAWIPNHSAADQYFKGIQYCLRLIPSLFHNMGDGLTVFSTKALMRILQRICSVSIIEPSLRSLVPKKPCTYAAPINSHACKPSLRRRT